MKLTRKKALEICIELWTWLAETGRQKTRWEGWEKYGKMESNCPFCELTKKSTDCERDCPIGQGEWQHCGDMGFFDWDDATTKTQRKKYAKIFLERLLELK